MAKDQGPKDAAQECSCFLTLVLVYICCVHMLCKDVNHAPTKNVDNELTARTRSWWVFNRCGVVVAKTVYIIHTWMIGGGCFTHIPVGVSLPSDHERRSLTHSTHLLLNLHTPHPGIGMYHRYAQRSFAR